MRKLSQNEPVYFEYGPRIQGVGYVNGRFDRTTRDGTTRNWIVQVVKKVEEPIPPMLGMMECGCGQPDLIPEPEFSHIVVPDEFVYPVSQAYVTSWVGMQDNLKKHRESLNN